MGSAQGGSRSAITSEIRLQADRPFGPQVLEVRNRRRTLLPGPSVLLRAALSGPPFLTNVPRFGIISASEKQFLTTVTRVEPILPKMHLQNATKNRHPNPQKLTNVSRNLIKRRFRDIAFLINFLITFSSKSALESAISGCRFLSPRKAFKRRAENPKLDDSYTKNVF